MKWGQQEAIMKMAAYVAVAAAVLLACANLGHSQPPANADPSLAPWFQSLKIPGTDGVSCCSIADCRPTSYRTHGDHYEVLAGHDDKGAEIWLPVPPDRVLQRFDNPTGRAVACILGGQVLCFVKASES